MRIKQNIAGLLLSISLFLLMIPVIPHHHHADGHLCMKNDISTDCCTHSGSTETDTHHHGCDTDCITIHFFEQMPGTDENSTLHLDAPEAITLLAETLSMLLLPAETEIQPQQLLYREALYDTCIVRAVGLRAPPSFA